MIALDYSLTLTDSPAKHFVLPLYVNNLMEGETYGGEITADCRLTSWWRMQLTYSCLEMQLHPGGDKTGFIYFNRNPNISKTIRWVSVESYEYRSPHNIASLRSSFDFLRDVNLDLWLRYVDALSHLDISSYFGLDARIAWKPQKNLEFSLCGQNLLYNHHREFESTLVGVAATEIERSVYAMVTWRF